ncbi:hypothetical protein ACFQI7_26115 [Paenibacillus allorhizosphaerae]|uniref:MucB/RseB N-terminal domain-containing protein n=1 Tax=Paenibacillus allorhizosphaerae TaxID=2849866 RepID=A0ABM8VJN9_9BACL|nr:hypothetical protein [Paenibacillus allorhizosphaerae]CAG7645771.1 hypothetical protein PAECIP111802_03600 [Paenibacillus allorhizosphaerae]
MDPIDKELKEGLTNGPFGHQDGFSDSLRKRIERRIEEKVKPRRSRMPWFAGTCVVLAAAACLLVGDWQSLLPHQAMNTAAETAQPIADIQYYADDQQAVPLQSALLIGLRTDQQSPQIGEQFSTYRTLLIAPEQNRLQTIAEGSGILMPYKMSFWKIVNERRESAHEETRTLSAYLTSNSKTATRQLVAPPVKPLTQSEKLLFAGNRYMAVEQTLNDRSTKEAASKYEYVWVKELGQITGRDKLTMAPLREPHVTLRSIYGADTADPAMRKLQPALPVQPGEPASRTAAAAAADTAGESWTITRKQGQWVPQVADYSAQPSSKEHRYELKDFPASLPESVVSHDRLVAGWQEIKRLRPSANDAFSSPTEDMVAVVSERDVVIYPYQNRLIASPLLSFNLGRNESVVMVQWAVGDYVEQWKQQAKMYLDNE